MSKGFLIVRAWDMEFENEKLLLFLVWFVVSGFLFGYLCV